jgi:hypothetical protein
MHFAGAMRETSPLGPDASTVCHDARYSAKTRRAPTPHLPHTVFDDEDGGHMECLIPPRPVDAMMSAPRQALSGGSGRGQSGEADERRDADGNRADDSEDRLPGG